MTPFEIPTRHGLTPVQEAVIAAITGGATMKAAAEAASIHRNTVSYWRRTSPAFCQALSDAQYDKAIFLREEAETYLAEAFAVIRAILLSPTASAAARLNAARYIIDKASVPPPPKREVLYDFLAEEPEIVHDSAQSQGAQSQGAQSQDAQSQGAQSPDAQGKEAQHPADTHNPAQRPAAQTRDFVHKAAQSAPPQPVRASANVGRNEPCPCGSRLKFKRCCLGKPKLAKAA